MKKWPTCEEYCLYWIGRCWNDENYPDPQLGGKGSICMFAIDQTDEAEIKRIVKIYPDMEELLKIRGSFGKVKK